MRFRFSPNHNLPRLAWCVVLERGSNEVFVHHGPWVEAHENFFVDGVWDGPFDEGDFDRSTKFNGTGGRIRGGKLTIAAPCHPFERLHSVRAGERLFISSSLSFVLEKSGQELSLQFVPYQTSLLRLVSSVIHNVGTVPLEGDVPLNLYHYRNLEIDSNLDIRILPKPEPQACRNYDEYQACLTESLRALVTNASDPGRTIRYTPLTTVSSGYDSAACAALALDLGCKEALTIRTSRSDDSDTGAPVARDLGLEIREYDRDTYRSKPGYPEAEFVACGDLGQDVVMLSFEDSLERTLLLTGFHGDTVWGRKPRGGAAHDFRRPDAAGCSLTEYRSRVGFQHVPVPCLGGINLPEINAISNSSEMAHWTLGTAYDRPIPRRLAEERGVARKHFGQSKKAITVLLNQESVLRQFMGVASAESFQGFYEAHRSKREVKTQSQFNRMFRLSGLCSKILGKPNAMLRRLINWQIPNPIPFRYSQPPGAPSFLIHWGQSLVRDRYHVRDVTSPPTHGSSHSH